MNENIENSDWTKDAPALAAMQKRNPFTVPNGYFDSVDEHVASAIFVSGLNRKMNNVVLKFRMTILLIYRNVLKLIFFWKRFQNQKVLSLFL